MGISTQQALDCFRSDDLIGIGGEADAVRRRLHPEGVVSYRCLLEFAVAPERLPLTEAAAGSSAALRLICAMAGSLTQVADQCREVRRDEPARWIEVGLQADAIEL